ncbi:MAG TPA: DMT family transporter [Kofleriaceae bacterium]|nr:DMT family transporter [Kofleriaceae bacterium]
MATAATTRSEHRRALLLLAVCGLAWSSGGVLIKLVDWHPMAIWSTRSALAALLLWVVRRPSLRGLGGGEWAAALALAATTGLFILANKLTTAANAILIQYSAPIWIALLGRWFLGERASRLDWITIGLVLGGIVLFFADELAPGHLAGNLVALGAGIAFAFSAMTLRRVALSRRDDRPIDPLRPVVLGNLVAAALGAPFLFLDAPPGAAGWAALAALGFLQQGAAYLAFTWAIRHATALESMLIPIVEPILSPVWVALAVGEIPGPWSLLGGAIVVGSVSLRAALSRAPA